MLVTVDDLTTYMDVKLSPKARLAAAYILEGLQNELELYLGRPIEVNSYNETYKFLEEPHTEVIPFWSNIGFGGSGNSYPARRTILLRNSPVISVSYVYVSRTGSASAVALTATEFGVRRFGIDIWNPSTDDEYEVGYVAGLNGANYPALKAAILRAAAREAQNMHDDNAGIQDLEGRQAAISQTGFLDSELRGLRRLRRQRI